MDFPHIWSVRIITNMNKSRDNASHESFFLIWQWNAEATQHFCFKKHITCKDKKCKTSTQWRVWFFFFTFVLAIISFYLHPSLSNHGIRKCRMLASKHERPSTFPLLPILPTPTTPTWFIYRMSLWCNNDTCAFTWSWVIRRWEVHPKLGSAAFLLPLVMRNSHSVVGKGDALGNIHPWHKRAFLLLPSRWNRDIIMFCKCQAYIQSTILCCRIKIHLGQE